MKSNQKKMISEFVKQGRMAKGYTQKELSELSNISVRSIQRIENGEILPRSYTLKTLSEILGLSFDELQNAEPARKHRFKLNRNQKLILSVGLSLFIILLSWAYISQSPSFPETNFEFFVFAAVVLLLLTAFLTIIWRKKAD